MQKPFMQVFQFPSLFPNSRPTEDFVKKLAIKEESYLYAIKQQIALIALIISLMDKFDGAWFKSQGIQLNENQQRTISNVIQREFQYLGDRKKFIQSIKNNFIVMSKNSTFREGIFTRIHQLHPNFIASAFQELKKHNNKKIGNIGICIIQNGKEGQYIWQPKAVSGTKICVYILNNVLLCLETELKQQKYQPKIKQPRAKVGNNWVFQFFLFFILISSLILSKNRDTFDFLIQKKHSYVPDFL